MNRVSGTYQSGQVILDEPVDWPEGAQVKVVCEKNHNTDSMDICIDGSKWEDTPEARRTWIEWHDSLEPVFTGRELTDFELAQKKVREEQKALLPKWQEKIENLLK